MEHRVAALFSGQGVVQRGIPESGLLLDHIRDTFQEIDRVATSRFGVALSSTVLGCDLDRYWSMERPELIQLAVFGHSIATYSACEKGRNWKPSVMVGHGFGEIMALVSGGAFSVGEENPAGTVMAGNPASAARMPLRST